MRFWLIPLCVVTPLASCDQVRTAMGKAKTVVGSVAAKGEDKSGGRAAPGGEIEPTLAALVDRNEEGVRFRKDLEFPTRLRTRKTTSIRYHNARVMRRSALGTENLTMDGTTDTVSQWRLTDGRIDLSMEKMTFTLPPEKTPKPDAKKNSPVPQQPSPVGQAIPMERVSQLKSSFVKAGAGWRAENARSGDFLRAAWLQKVQPGFESLAIEAGVLPRTMWFGKPRWKEGAAMTLEGENLKMLQIADKVTGKVQLIFEAVEAVGGHPCGRFSASGSYSAAGLAADDGSQSDVEVTISSGKVWFSLLYPLVVRQELDTIVTGSTNADGVPTRIQGRATVTLVSEWNLES